MQRDAYVSREGGFNREGFVEELLVESLLWLVDHNHCHSVLIVLRPSRSSHHLQYIRDGEVHIPPAHVPILPICASRHARAIGPNNKDS